MQIEDFLENTEESSSSEFIEKPTSVDGINLTEVILHGAGVREISTHSLSSPKKRRFWSHWSYETRVIIFLTGVGEERPVYQLMKQKSC